MPTIRFVTDILFVFWMICVCLIVTVHVVVGYFYSDKSLVRPHLQRYAW